MLQSLFGVLRDGFHSHTNPCIVHFVFARMNKDIYGQIALVRLTKR